jgi:hypothetical protein
MGDLVDDVVDDVVDDLVDDFMACSSRSSCASHPDSLLRPNVIITFHTGLSVQITLKY